MRDKIPPLIWRNISAGVSAFVVVAWFAIQIFPDAFLAKAMITLAAIVGVADLLSAGYFWRCPECGKQLPFDRMFSVRSCPFCGEYLYY